MSKKNPIVEAVIQEAAYQKAVRDFDAELQVFVGSFNDAMAKEDLNYQQRFNDKLGQVVGILDSAKIEIRKVMKR